MVAMLMIQALVRRAMQMLARSAAARRVALVAIGGVLLAAVLRESPPAAPADAGGAAVVPQVAASASLAGTCDEPPATHRWAELAQRGELEALAALADGGGGGYNDAQAYKWLAAAADFGHPRAQAKVKSLLETTSLRQDDDGLLVGEVHHELGLAYLAGCEGLPTNLDLARQHLLLGRDGVMRTQRDFAEDRRGLPAAGLKVFDEVFTAQVLAAVAAEAASQAPSARRTAAPVLGARMVDFGVYRTVRFGRHADSAVAGGLAGTRGNELIRQTNRVPATIGTSFGFRYVLQGPGQDAEVTVRVLHPVPLRDPASGRAIAVSEWQQRLALGQVNWNTGWLFEHPWELAPGRWTVQLRGPSGLLLEKHFEVVAP